MTGRRVVIIGAGVVGAALADELSAKGWDDRAASACSQTARDLPDAARRPAYPDTRGANAARATGAAQTHHGSKQTIHATAVRTDDRSGA